MTTYSQTITPGWAWPKGARAWHFVNQYGVSLCLAHQLDAGERAAGTMELEDDMHPLCRRCLEARRERTAQQY